MLILQLLDLLDLRYQLVLFNLSIYENTSYKTNPPLIKGNLQPNYSLFLKEAQYNALNCTLWHMYDFYLYLYTHLQKVQMNRKVHLFLVQEAVKSGAQG